MRASFAGDIHAPASARTFVRERLHVIVDPGGPPVGDDVLLIVSELVTNSVRSGAETIDLEIEVGVDQVDVRVTDDGTGWPQGRTAGIDDLGGRGLTIIEVLTDTWDTTAHGLRKTVTATWFRHRP